MEENISQKEKEKAGEKEGEKPQVALPNGGNFDYNSIKTVAASGNVRASYTNKEGETSNAQADKITYNAKTGEIILTGSPVIITPDISSTTGQARDITCQRITFLNEFRMNSLSRRRPE